MNVHAKLDGICLRIETSVQLKCESGQLVRCADVPLDQSYAEALGTKTRFLYEMKWLIKLHTLSE